MLNSLPSILGTGAPPAVPNSYYSIATQTVGSGGASSITFSSIPSTYTHLQIRMSALVSVSPVYIKTQFNGDTSSNYSWHELGGDGSSVNAGAGATQTFGIAADGFSSYSSSVGVGIVDILDYANTNKYKTMRSLSGQDTNNASYGYVFFNSSLWRSTNAITSISLAPVYGTFNQYSSFALYGVN